MPISIPLAFAENTTLREGDAGRDWLASLPDLVRKLLRRWGCDLAGDVLHGAVGVVVPVTWRGMPAAVKVSFPHSGNVGEWAALTAFNGRGAVRLHDVDPDLFAMLLERAHAGHDLSSVGRLEDALTIAGNVAKRLAVPATPDITRLSDAARDWAADLVQQHHREDRGDQLPDEIVASAATTFHQLTLETTDALIHGDLHCSNILRGDREPWLVIDPKGYSGTACFDAGTIVREGLLHLVAEADDLSGSLIRRVSIFSDAASIDREMAMRCTQARFVSSYYWELQQSSPRAVVDAMRAAAVAATLALV